MTVIATRKYKDKIVIAADSQTTWGDSGKTLSRSKIIKLDNLIIGCAGSGEDSALFRIFLLTHKLKDATEDDIVTLLGDFMEWKKKKTGDSKFLLHFLFISNNKIFESYCYGVRTVKGEFAAVGYGMFLALGAMELKADPIKAVEIAIKHDVYCGGEVISMEIPVEK